MWRMLNILRDPGTGAGGSGGGGAGAGAGSGAGAATITPEAINGLQGDAFRALLPEDVRGAGWLKDVNTFGDFVKKSAGAQSLLGQRAVPDANATPEQWDAWFAQVNAPSKPDAYAMPDKIDGIPDEYVKNAQEAKVLHAAMAAGRILPAQAKAFTTALLKQTYAAEQAEQKADEEAFDKLMNGLFGQNRGAIQENGKKYIASVVPAEIQGQFGKLSNEAWAVLIAATDAIAKKFGQEDNFRGGQAAGSGGAETEDQLKGQMRDIMAQKEYQDPLMNKTKHAELMQKMEVIRGKLAKIYNKV